MSGTWVYCQDHWEEFRLDKVPNCAIICPPGVMTCDVIIGYYTDTSGERKAQRCNKVGVYGVVVHD